MLIKLCITEVIEYIEPDNTVEFELRDAPDYKVEFDLDDAVASVTTNDNYVSANSWDPNSRYEDRQAVEAEEVPFQISLKSIQKNLNLRQKMFLHATKLNIVDVFFI